MRKKLRVRVPGLINPDESYPVFEPCLVRVKG